MKAVVNKKEKEWSCHTCSLKWPVFVKKCVCARIRAKERNLQYGRKKKEYKKVVIK